MYDVIDRLPNDMMIEVVDELTSVEFASRTHGTRSCHNAGCRGPLCRKFNRDRSRKEYRKKNPAARTRNAKDTEVDQILNLIIHIQKEKAEDGLAKAV